MCIPTDRPLRSERSLRSAVSARSNADPSWRSASRQQMPRLAEHAMTSRKHYGRRDQEAGTPREASVTEAAFYMAYCRIRTHSGVQHTRAPVAWSDDRIVGTIGKPIENERNSKI